MTSPNSPPKVGYETSPLSTSAPFTVIESVGRFKYGKECCIPIKVHLLFGIVTGVVNELECMDMLESLLVEEGEGGRRVSTRSMQGMESAFEVCDVSRWSVACIPCAVGEEDVANLYRSCGWRWSGDDDDESSSSRVWKRTHMSILYPFRNCECHSITGS
jgi:hypothetical protein